jgi:hypothetical protein
MAHLDTIPEDSINSVARGIATLVDENLAPTEVPNENVVPLDVEEEGAQLTIGETLTVWKLKPEAFEALAKSRLSGDLVEWVEETPLLYHQIKLNGEAQGFAHSRLQKETNERTLLNVNASSIASEVDQLLLILREPDKIVENHERDDAFFASDPVVRLLEIPACRVFALWLLVNGRESRVIIIYATDIRSDFDRERILTSDQFFKALGQYLPKPGVG